MKSHNQPLLMRPLLLPDTVKEHNQGAKNGHAQDDQLSHKTNQALSREGSVTLNADETSGEMADTARPALPVKGRIVSWLTRKEDGAIVMGDLYPPGGYTLIACPEGSKPSELQGEIITGNHVGWFRVSGKMSVSHSVPTAPGEYLLVNPIQQ